MSLFHSFSSEGRGNPPLRRLELVALVIPSALLALLVALDYFVFEPLLPSVDAHLVVLLLGLAGVLTFSVAIFNRLADLQTRLARQNERLVRVTHDLQRRSDQLRTLSAAGTALSSERSATAVLQTVADLAREVADARYGALASFDEEGAIAQFHVSGMTPAERALLHEAPTGRGLLGLAARDGRALRISDVRGHPAAVGFPPGHPPMRNLLAVPLSHRDRTYGVLYVGDKRGATEFSAEDEEALVTLAAKAAIAIENARLLEQVQEIAMLEERNRIGIDLHDGAIQSLYGVSLVIEDAADHAAVEPDASREALRKAVDRLNATIADLRAYVLGLKPVSMEGVSLRESLQALAASARSSALVAVTVDVDDEAVAALDAKLAENIFYIAAGAVANVVRHARARRAEVCLAPVDDHIALTVADDGVGFDAGTTPEGDGLRGIADRVRAIGATLAIDTAPGRGTRLRVDIPAATVMAR